MSASNSCIDKLIPRTFFSYNIPPLGIRIDEYSTASEQIEKVGITQLAWMMRPNIEVGGPGYSQNIEQKLDDPVFP